MNVIKLAAFGFACAQLFVIAGCGGGVNVASVEGTVSLDGKPLEGAYLSFIPEVGGRPAGAVTDSSGKYVLKFTKSQKGAIPGKNRVQITTKSDPLEGQPGKPELLGMEYNTNSTLEFNVEEKKRNIADFELKSGGRIAKNQNGY